MKRDRQGSTGKKKTKRKKKNEPEEHVIKVVSLPTKKKDGTGSYFDWKSPQGQVYIANCVEEWDNYAKNKMHLYEFAELMRIPTSTLQLYCCANRSERLIAGAPRNNNIGLEVGKIEEVALALYKSSPNKLVKRATAMTALRTKFGDRISEGQSSSQWSKVVKPRIEELMSQHDFSHRERYLYFQYLYNYPAYPTGHALAQGVTKSTKTANNTQLTELHMVEEQIQVATDGVMLYNAPNLQSV